MTHTRGTLCNSLGVASVVIALLELPVVAIEKPQLDEDTQNVAPTIKQSRLLKPSELIKPELIQPNNINRLEQINQTQFEKAPMLGVGGSPVSGTLAKHLGLEKGHGLTIYHVVPESTAAQVGLKEHDILTAFNDHPVGCQTSLRDAVMTCSPGDSVSLKFISDGNMKEASGTLGERLVHATGNISKPRAQGNSLGNSGNTIRRPNSDAQFIDQHMQRHMMEMQRLLENNHGMSMNLHGLLQQLDSSVPNGQQNNQQADRQGIHDIMGGAIDLDQLQSLQNDDRAQGMNIQFNSTSTVTRRDNEGSVSLKTMNGLKELIVKDNQGNVVFEGPYKTDTHKSAVPENIRQRLDQMNFDQNNECDYRMHIDGGKLDLKPRRHSSGEANKADDVQ